MDVYHGLGLGSSTAFACGVTYGVGLREWELFVILVIMLHHSLARSLLSWLV